MFWLSLGVETADRANLDGWKTDQLGTIPSWCLYRTVEIYEIDKLWGMPVVEQAQTDRVLTIVLVPEKYRTLCSSM